MVHEGGETSKTSQISSSLAAELKKFYYVYWAQVNICLLIEAKTVIDTVFAATGWGYHIKFKTFCIYDSFRLQNM